MIAADLVVVGVVAAIFTGVAGLITAGVQWRDSRHKPDEAWVGLVEKASSMLEERVERVEQDNVDCQAKLARTQRNIVTLRAALVKGGIAVPPLE